MSRKRRSKGAAGEDHVDAGGLVGPVGDCGGSDDRVGAGEAGAGAVGDVDRGGWAGAAVDLGHRVDEITAAPRRTSARATSARITALSARRPVPCGVLAQGQVDEGVEHAA
jgi:hypothetical protein